MASSMKSRLSAVGDVNTRQCEGTTGEHYMKRLAETGVAQEQGKEHLGWLPTLGSWKRQGKLLTRMQRKQWPGWLQLDLELESLKV